MSEAVGGLERLLRRDGVVVGGAPSDDRDQLALPGLAYGPHGRWRCEAHPPGSKLSLNFR
jgi:hypothetical protein